MFRGRGLQGLGLKDSGLVEFELNPKPVCQRSRVWVSGLVFRVLSAPTLNNWM